MQTGFLGVDIGSISTKAVIIDEHNNVISESYVWTEGNPINAVKNVMKDLKEKINSTDISIESVGTTGSARALIGKMLDANIVKNEITSHAIGTLSIYPDVKTIFEIGGQDSKIILINNSIVTDYAMNTLCAAGTGSFLSSQAKRLGLDVSEFGALAIKSNNPTKIAARCTVFAESDLVHKAQIGHSKEDIVAGLCNAVVTNYLNNVGKGKDIRAPISFQGGVSKNIGVVNAFKRVTGKEILVSPNSHLIGALGVAILSKDTKNHKIFDFNTADCDFKTIGHECNKCANNCELIQFYKDNKLIDTWGNKCENGLSSS